MVQGNALRDPSGRMTHRDLPPMACTLNFLMTDINWENGPCAPSAFLAPRPRPPSDPVSRLRIRQIPGTQNSPLKMPSPAEE